MFLEAMESLLRRWDHCAESRCKAVESQVVKLVDEARPGCRVFRF